MAAFCADHILISEHLDIGSWVEVMHSGETIATDIPSVMDWALPDL